MTAAAIVAATLRRAGVRRAFVAPGADATLIDAHRDAGLAIVAAASAGAACVMAAVTGRVADAPGLALIPAEEPGVPDALTAVARDPAPLVVLASRAPERAGTSNMGAPQLEDPQTPIKATIVAGPESAAHWAAHAVHAALGEPPGCAWLVIAPAVATGAALPVATAVRPAPAALAPAELDVLARAIGDATRPLLVAGRGCRVATAPWLRAFAEALPAPVLVTPAARGAMPDPHPLCHGLLTRASAVLARADLVIALGVGDDELAAAEVALPSSALRVGPVAMVLEELAPRLRNRARADWDVAELDRLRRARPAPAVEPALGALVTRLREATPAGTAAVFARPLAALTPLWHAVQPGEVLVEDDVLLAGAALALERPDAVVLAFGATEGVPMVEGVWGSSSCGAPMFNVRVLAPPAAMLARVLVDALDASGPRVLVVPTAG